jgi:homoserine kinase
VRAWSWTWPPAVTFVVATPATELETAVARKILPATIPLGDAVFNLQHALLLVRALETGRFGDLREAFRDRWHQPHRQTFVPGLREALAIDDPSILGVCLSGSGPSVAAFTAGQAGAASERLAGIYHALGVPHTIRTLRAHQPAAAATRH